VFRANSVSWPQAEGLLWRPAFRVFTLRFRAWPVCCSLLERRRIAHPKAKDYGYFQVGLQQGFATREIGLRGLSPGSRPPRDACTAMFLQSHSPTSWHALPGAYWHVAERSKRDQRCQLLDALPAEVCERTRRDGGSVFSARANTGDPNGPLRPIR
jgi:hypothetical protein